MTTAELAEELFNSIKKSWVISYEKNTIELTNPRVDWIRINLDTKLTMLSVNGQVFKSVSRIENCEQAKISITELMNTAIQFHLETCKKLDRAIVDIGE